MTISIFLFIFLIIGTISDIRKRSIPVLLFILFGTAGTVLRFFEIITENGSAVSWAFGLLPGAVFIGLSLISDKKLGMGDALAVLVTGIYMGGYDAALSVLYAMMITALFSIVILILRKGTRHTEIPFFPFLLTGCILQHVGAIL